MMRWSVGWVAGQSRSEGNRIAALRHAGSRIGVAQVAADSRGPAISRRSTDGRFSMAAYLELEKLVVGRRYWCTTYLGDVTINVKYVGDGWFVDRGGFHYTLDGDIRYVLRESA